MTRLARAGVAALLGAVMVLGAALPALAATPRASFNDIEDEVMCVTCNVPLNIAESAQANEERGEIKRLIALGLTKQQIKAKLVDEYTDSVLADPPRDGFNITTWLVPIGAIGGVAVLLVLTLPRWRRKDDGGTTEAAAGPSLTPADRRRLDDDLAATEI